MTSVLYGMLGAVIVDGLAVVVAALTLPRLLKRAMKKQLGGQLFGKTAAGWPTFPPVSPPDRP